MTLEKTDCVDRPHTATIGARDLGFSFLGSGGGADESGLN